ELGRIGRLKASMRIVLRVETPPGNPAPPLLREASYRSFKGPIWFSETPRGGFETVQPETNQTTWVLMPKTNTWTVNIACYLPSRIKGFNNGLLPLPTGSGQLENLPAYLLSKNPLGTVLAQGPGLVIFDACYAPGVSIDSAPTGDDLEVPKYEQEALRKVIADSGIRGATSSEACRALQNFFSEKFSYSLWQERDLRPRAKDTPLSRFLLQTRSGHCEYFATASVLLLRELGIPARYAVGHAVHEAAGTRKFVVRDRDAHAWCLVWNEERRIWEDFDTTPGSWVQAEQKAAAFQWLSDFWSRVKFELSRLRWGQTRLRQYLLWTVVPVLVLLLYRIIFRRRGRKRRPVPQEDLSKTWPGLDSEFFELAARMERRGVVRQPGESLSGWLSRAMAEPALEPFHQPLWQLMRLHYQYRFDPLGISGEQRQQLRAEARECLARLNRVG
ncbi:MAG TPA: transglutaminase domain-containing protein, partial [Clostridia bacterium]|nr:transglutaminase domain-containing protein [Clostridia bacterium]